MVWLVGHVLWVGIRRNGRKTSSQGLVGNIVLRIESSFGGEGGVNLEDRSAVEMPLNETQSLAGSQDEMRWDEGSNGSGSAKT